jgi:hypothetical protein
MWIRCHCTTPGCSGVVVLRATPRDHAEGSCAECREMWTLVGGHLLHDVHQVPGEGWDGGPHTGLFDGQRATSPLPNV